MKIKALIFDVDGTLADTEEAHRCSFNRAFELHRLRWHWSEPEYAGLLKITGGKERIGAYVDSLAIETGERRQLQAQIPAIHATKIENYTELVREGLVPLRDGVARLIEEAEQAGVRLAIASTTTLANIEALLTVNLGGRGLTRFSVIGAADQALRKKPAPDIFEYVLKELQERAADCVAIEDSAGGLAAARGAGLFTVITPSRWTLGEDFGGADLVLRSLGASPHPLRDIENCFSLAHNKSRRTHFAARRNNEHA
jgi:beta-phosphoglucomutase-like phosphatase (HAD superfamily)